MEIEARLLEEWKANHDLFKFYEDLKQKRFAHFLTIQTAFEEQWKSRSPDNHFSTYQQMFAVLSRRDGDVAEKYLGARNLPRDSYGELMRSTSAHASEHAILKMFWWLWITLASLALLIHLGWHLIHGFAMTMN
jgi:hypothetical protein